MKIAIYDDKIKGYHLLTNEGLEVGDEVFSLIDTYHHDGEIYVTNVGWKRDTDFAVLACTGWPSDPHTIQSFYVDNKVQYLRTDKGYSPAYCYFKRIASKSAGD